MNNLEYCRTMQAGDCLMVRTGGYFAHLIRMHETVHHPGRVYTNHNVPIAINSGGQKYAVQIAPPHVELIPLPDYIQWMERQCHLWHCVRPAWIKHEEHPPGILNAWRYEFSEYVLGLDGKKYPKRDLWRLVLLDITFGLINLANRGEDYCTEGEVHGWMAAQRIHRVPDSVDEINYPGPGDIEQLLIDRDVLPICGNSPWLIRNILNK